MHDEAGHRGRPLVVMEPDVGERRVVVDDRVHEVVADCGPQLAAEFRFFSRRQRRRPKVTERLPRLGEECATGGVAQVSCRQAYRVPPGPGVAAASRKCRRQSPALQLGQIATAVDSVPTFIHS